MKFHRIIENMIRNICKDYINSNEEVLFENVTGVSGNIQLSKSVLDFKQLKIEFTDTVNHSVIEVFSIQNKSFVISETTVDRDGSLYIYTTRYILNSKNINLADNNYSSLVIGIDKNIYITHKNSLKITKVIGIK